MSNQGAIVTTSLGAVKGTTHQGVYSWRGIPYAQPLKESRMFAPPVPSKKWDGVLDATSYSGICPQRSLLRTKISDSCLTLNIWSPHADESARPVLFFIHGGSFSHGAGSESLYNGAYLAKTWNIVVVTCNYRLGAFGFLDFSFLDKRCTSNNGVRDVLLALQWVQNHIADFGGDPNLVTIAGQSAGGTMVSALVTTPQAKTLFHRAIMMSGGPTQLQSVQTCIKTSKEFIALLQVSTAQELFSLDFDTIILAQKKFIKKYGMGAATFRITVDESLIPQFPIVAALKKNTAPIPLLIGTTKAEMGFMAIKPLARLIDVGKIVSDGLQLETPEIRNQLLDTYNDLYGEQKGLPMLYTDLLFRISSIWLAQAHHQTWMYRFDYETRFLQMNGLHAIHSTDLPYVFGNFKTVMARPLFLMTTDMAPVHAIAQEIQSDFVFFMHNGTLPWTYCTQEEACGRCYKVPPSVELMVHETLIPLYVQTDYHARSHQGIGL